MRLNQNGVEAGETLWHYVSVASGLPGRKQAPYPADFSLRNVVTPYCSLVGKRTVRWADSDAGEDAGRSECLAVMVGIQVST